MTQDLICTRSKLSLLHWEMRRAKFMKGLLSWGHILCYILIYWQGSTLYEDVFLHARVSVPSWGCQEYHAQHFIRNIIIPVLWAENLSHFIKTPQISLIMKQRFLSLFVYDNWQKGSSCKLVSQWRMKHKCMCVCVQTGEVKLRFLRI